MKLKAFTIAELIIVLIISGIVISISFWGVNTLVKHFHQSELSYSNAQETLSFERDLRVSNALATTFSIQDDGFIIVDSNNDSIFYTTRRDTIYRNTSDNNTPLQLSNAKASITIAKDTATFKIAEDELSFKLNKTISAEINTLLK